MLVPSVNEALEKNNIQDIIIVGIESHICVLQTTLDIVRGGKYTPYVLADGVSSCNPEEIPIALQRIRDTGKAHVTTSEAMLFQLLGESGVYPSIPPAEARRLGTSKVRQYPGDDHSRKGDDKNGASDAMQERRGVKGITMHCMFFKASDVISTMLNVGE